MESTAMIGPDERVNRWVDRHGLNLTGGQIETLCDQILMAEVESASRMRETCITQSLDFRETVRNKAIDAETQGDIEGAGRMAALAAASTILCDYFRDAEFPVKQNRVQTESWSVSSDPDEPISLDRVRLMKQLEDKEPLGSATILWFYGGGTSILHTLHYTPPTHIEPLDHHEWLVDNFEEVLLGLRLA